MKLFTACLCSCVPLLAGADVAPRYCKPEPHNRDSVYVWQDRHVAVKARNRAVPPEIICIGDSITHFWGGVPMDCVNGNFSPRRGQDSWEKLFAGTPVTNAGFGFDTIDNAYFRVADGELAGTSPRVVTVLLGANDLLLGTFSKDVPLKYGELLALIRKNVPEAKILILGILPGLNRAFTRAGEKVNAQLKQFAVPAENIFYADIAIRLRGEDGLPKPIYFENDKLHPNAAGYAVMGEQLAIVLKTLENSASAQKK